MSAGDSAFEGDGGAARSVRVEPAARLRGVLEIPGDKSISHRALLLGALARGDTIIERLAPGHDVRTTLACVRQLGAVAAVDEVGARAVVHGVGPGSIEAPDGPLDCANSGTTMRLLAGVLASYPVEATLVGDASLSRRPMARVARPLRDMGATIEGTSNEAGADRPPLKVRGLAAPRAIRYESPVASAQVKSCVLLCGLRAAGRTAVLEPVRSRDHTERMLRLFGVDVLDADDGAVTLRGPVELEACTIFVPGDISQATFALCAAAGLPGSRIVLRDVGVNATRTGALDVLERMGVSVLRGGVDDWGFEPVADLVVHAPERLLATTIGGAEVPRLIDEIPVLAVLATQAHGRFEVTGAAELRVKESDRLAATQALIEALGGRVEPRPDGLAIEGPQRLSGGHFDAAGDHRMAMAAAIGGLFSTGGVDIAGADAVAVSWPRFFEDLASLRDA